MDRATPRMRKLAKVLMGHEASSNRSLAQDVPAAVHVVEKLRPHLANLMGQGGFRALLSRALVLATAEVFWLRGVQVRANGTLEGFERTDCKDDQTELLEGSVVLLGQLVGLLAAFIGLTLTSRLIIDVWPELRSAIWAVTGEEVSSEKAK